MDKLRGLVIILSFIFITSCNNAEYHYNPAPFSNGTIKGRATDSFTGNPISSVSIATQPLTSLTMTDINGEYIIFDVAIGTYTITANKDDYFNKSLSLIVCGDTAIVNFSLDEKFLSPGDARIDGTIGGINWTSYTSSGSCEKLGNDIKISSSFGLGSNTYSIIIYISNPIGVDTLNLGPQTNSYMQYERNLYGYLETNTTQTQGGTGEIEIIYFNYTNKSIKGNFNTVMAEVGSSYYTKSAYGSFKGTWQ